MRNNSSVIADRLAEGRSRDNFSRDGRPISRGVCGVLSVQCLQESIEPIRSHQRRAGLADCRETGYHCCELLLAIKDINFTNPLQTVSIFSIVFFLKLIYFGKNMGFWAHGLSEIRYTAQGCILKIYSVICFIDRIVRILEILVKVIQ